MQTQMFYEAKSFLAMELQEVVDKIRELREELETHSVYKELSPGLQDLAMAEALESFGELVDVLRKEYTVEEEEEEKEIPDDRDQT